MFETTTGIEARTDTDASRHQKPPVCSSNREASREDAHPEDREDAHRLKRTPDHSPRVMTDGGRDVVEPDDVDPYDPAMVHLDGGETLFVPNYRLYPSGWLGVMDWSRDWTKYPPHRVQKVDTVRTETYGDRDPQTGIKPERIVDDDLREQARRLAQPTEVEAHQEAIADD